MKSKYNFLVVLALFVCCHQLSAQVSNIPQRNEIVTIESEIAGVNEVLEVFDSPKDGYHHYYLAVGHLGLGDVVVQVLFDPIFELFLPLGNTLDEALANMEEMQALFKEPKGTSIEKQGCLALGFPKDEDLETVRVTYVRPILTRMLDFTVEREGYIRSTQVQRSDFNSLVSGVKFYKRLHPNE